MRPEEDIFDENEEYPFDGIFNAHLLDDEYLDSQPYMGEQYSDNSGDSEDTMKRKLLKYGGFTKIPYAEMSEHALRKDIKKHLNVDFGNSENDSSASYREDSDDDRRFFDQMDQDRDRLLSKVSEDFDGLNYQRQ